MQRITIQNHVTRRVYILDDNVKYISIDKRNKNQLRIHYTNGIQEDIIQAPKVYDRIIAALKHNGTFISDSDESS